MAEAAATATAGKVVLKNIGLLLSGDIDRPILDEPYGCASDAY